MRFSDSRRSSDVAYIHLSPAKKAVHRIPISLEGRRVLMMYPETDRGKSMWKMNKGATTICSARLEHNLSVKRKALSKWSLRQ
jgi:hypothetical protein